MRPSQGLSREGNASQPDRRSRPRVEGLEERLLLYATLGGEWVYGARITYSFVQDGTSVGGVPSSLYSSLAPLGQANWQREIHEAMSVWQAVANVNLVEVPDDGSPIGVYGNQQSDSRFGDIRIAAIPLAYGTMGAAYSPPQLNGGTLAGDIVFNSAMNWRIDAHYDLKTVAIHEIGHALGMSHSNIGAAVMYSYYTSIKQNLATDDVNGVRSIYDARQPDFWNSNGRSNLMYWDAVSLDGARTPLNQITVANLNIHGPGQTEWFWVTVPPNNIGRFTVTVQSSNLSLLTPWLTVADSSLGNAVHAYATGFGGTAVATVEGVSAYQGFFIRIATSGGGTTGSFAVQINFGTSPMAPVAPPYTVVPYQASHGGGLNTMTTPGGDDHDHDHHGHELEQVKIGSLTAWGDTLRASGVAAFSATAGQLLASASAVAGSAGGFNLLASAAADAARVWSSLSPTVSPAWNGMPTFQASTVDDALVLWGLDGFGQFSAARRKPAAS